MAARHHDIEPVKTRLGASDPRLANDDNKRRNDPAAPGTAVITKTKPQTKRPSLYRVLLPAPADEAAAYALRDRIAEIGFADARVVRTF